MGPLDIDVLQGMGPAPPHPAMRGRVPGMRLSGWYSRTHTDPRISRIPEGVPESPLGPLWLLKTNLEAAKLRRNIRLVGQLLLAPDSRWDWLQEAERRELDEAVASSGEEVEEEAHVDGGGDTE